MEKKLIFYEVNPLYFRDTNNDGIGDLKGMLKQSTYFSHLGVDAIIIPNILSMYSDTPVYEESYKAITPQMGTIHDFQKFSNKMRMLGIKIIIDINIGSIKENHEWFKRVSSSKQQFGEIIAESATDDQGKVIITKEMAKLGKVKLNKKTNTYYFVNEKTEEISLNWASGTIQKKFLDVAKFWNNLGVQGFRFSNFEFIGQGKPENKLQEEPTLIQLRKFYCALKEMNENFLVIGKSKIISPSEAKKLLDEKTRVLDYFEPLNFSEEGLDKKYGRDVIGKFSFTKLVKLMKNYITNEKTILAFGSDLTGRVVSRWGGNDQYNVEVAKSLGILQLFSPGSTLIYYGEELGAKNMGLTHLDDFKDNTLIERKRLLHAQGVNIDDFMAAQVLQNPINSHTLMAWNDRKNGGFSRKAQTIVPASLSYRDINVMNQYTSDNAPLNFYRKLIDFVKTDEIQEILTKGKWTYKFQKLGRGALQITYMLGQKQIIVLSNFSTKPKNITQPNDFKILISSYYGKNYNQEIKTLQEYETIVFVKNITTKLQAIEPILPKRIPRENKLNAKNTSEIPKRNLTELETKKHEQQENVSSLLGKWKINKNSQKVTITKVNKTTQKVDDMEENLLAKKTNVQSTIEMSVPNSNNETKTKATKKEVENDLSGTIEMITNDIENTNEINLNDNILDAEEKDEIHDRKEEIEGALNIKKETDDVVAHEDEFLENERQQNTNINDKTHAFKIKNKS